MNRYTNKGFAEKITAKTLVVDGEAEEWGQAPFLPSIASLSGKGAGPHSSHQSLFGGKTKIGTDGV